MHRYFPLNQIFVCIALIGNSITDDGARALGAVLAGRSGLRLVDLRGNKIGIMRNDFYFLFK